jgi:hypothetical protein
MLEHMYPSEAEDLEDMESPPQRRPQDLIRSEVVRPRERQDHSEEEVFEGEHYRERREHHRRSSRREEPWTPLAVELEREPWPPRFNTVILS